MNFMDCKVEEVGNNIRAIRYRWTDLAVISGPSALGISVPPAAANPGLGRPTHCGTVPTNHKPPARATDHVGKP